MRRLAWLVAVAVAVAVIGGCSGKAHHNSLDFPKPSDYSQLVAKARVQTCPATTSAPAPKSLPPLTLPCLVPGPAVRLAALTGAPTVVNIWASWCTPCQAETAYLATVSAAANGKVRFLGVDTDDSAGSALDFAAHVTPPMRYPQVVDTDKRLLIALHLPSAVPTTVFVAADGRVVKISPGAFHSATALRADVHRYLGVTV